MIWPRFVKEPLQLWLTDRLAQRYHTRPSEVLGLGNSYEAYCLDQVVMTFCASVQSKLDDVKGPSKGKNKEERRQQEQQALLAKLLRLPDQAEKKQQKFRDPAEMLRQSK